MASTARLSELAKQISENTEIFNQYLIANKIDLSFDINATSAFPADAPREVTEARRLVQEATKELNVLVQGPAEYLRWLATTHHDMSSLRYIYHFKLAEHVPLEGKISYGELARKAGVDELQVKRVLRHAMTNFIFEEPQSGYVKHTVASALLVRERGVRDWIGFCVDESSMCSSKLVDAIKLGDKGKWAYQLAYDTDLPMFEHMKLFPERAERFANTMVDMTSTDGYHIRHLVGGFGWEKVEEGGVVVDVGGSTGHASIAIAEKVPHLKFVVQDLAAPISQGKDLVKTQSPSIQSRLAFQLHDFFTPQPPLAEPAIYLLRFILHDHPDSAFIKILKNIVQALKPGDRIVVMDGVSPEPGTLPASLERTIRIMDMEMMSDFNAGERELWQWEALFAAADPRLKLKNIVKPEGAAQAAMEVGLVESAEGK